MRHRLWRAYVRAGEIRELALRSVMPQRMNFVHYGWPLRTRLCPCDADFCSYLQQHDIAGKSIFHFGTGAHHIVGLRNQAAGSRNEILGLTLSTQEVVSYMKRVIRDPQLGRSYKVMFADIYSLSSRGLPSFDLVTLFHLCEFSATSAAGRRLDDAQVLELFWEKLNPEGLMFFYSGSFGFKKLSPLIAEAVAAERLLFVGQYRSLIVYKKGPGTGATHQDAR